MGSSLYAPSAARTTQPVPQRWLAAVRSSGPASAALLTAACCFWTSSRSFPARVWKSCASLWITVSRAAGSATYPSHFQLVAAMNPCKCGYYGHPTRQCTCSPSAVRQYRSRVSGPLLDRIDLCVEMDPIAFDELHTSAPSESSADLRKQVLAARAIQAKRYAAPGFEGVLCNAQLTAGQVRRVCRMTPAAERLLRASYDALGLSARAHDRILRVARTVADLAGKQLLDEDCVLEALQYRAQEKVEV